MANKKHLEILKEGVIAWNEWRSVNLIKPDLSGIQVNGLNLCKADLNNANLRNASIKDSNLKKSKLYNADISHADLSYTSLNNTDLCFANLSWANLSHASLICANLSKGILITYFINSPEPIKLVKTSINNKKYSFGFFLNITNMHKTNTRGLNKVVNWTYKDFA